MNNYEMSDLSFWIKFIQDSNLSTSHDTRLQYATKLANRFSTSEELLTADENIFINLGIISQLDRACLIRHARLSCDKKNSEHEEKLSVSNSTVNLRRKSKCNLSSTLLPRIPCLHHSNYNELTNANDTCTSEHSIEIQERTVFDDNDEKLRKLIESCQKKPLATSNHGKRTAKAFSDTIFLRKKIIAGTDRLKRLTISKSFFKNQTASVTKSISNIAHKLVNPLNKLKHKNPPVFIDNTKSTLRHMGMNNLFEDRKIEIVKDRNEVHESNDFSDYQVLDESTCNSHQLVPTLINKQFKIGAPTNFLTRSLAHYDYTK